MRNEHRLSLRWRFLILLGQSFALATSTTIFCALLFALISIAPKPFSNFAVWANRRPGLLGSAFILLFLALLAAYFILLTRGILARFRLIQLALERIAGGELAVRLSDRHLDELGSLARSVNAMAERLQSSAAEERRAVQAKHDLIAGVSHDLRTPLTSILGYLQLMADSLENGGKLEEIKTHARITYRKAKQLQGLVDDLFDFASLTDTGYRLRLQGVDLIELLRQLAEEFHPLFANARIVCAFAPASPGIRARVDPGLLVRALQNLLSNAVKYGNEGEDISLSMEEDAEAITIRVISRGRTVPEPELTRIFDRFYRHDDYASGPGGGTGLGLAIARQIVNLHQGEIFATSLDGITTFAIRLPNRPT